MKFLKNHKNKFFFIDHNYLVFLLFFIYFVIGLYIYKDYGISIDEPFQRTSGNYWYIWILENFFQNSNTFHSYICKIARKAHWKMVLVVNLK